MTVYEPATPQLGKNAIRLRVTALRAMNEADGPQYTRYERGGKAPSYVVETPSGAVRDLATREVPAYVVGAADSYAGVRAHVQEALDAALADKTVTDRDSLVRAVLSILDTRCGNSLAKAAGYFNATNDPAPAAAAVA